MKLLQVCAHDMILDPVSGECTACPSGRGTTGLDSFYCISCGDMWVNNDCDANDNQPICYQAQLICPDPLQVFLVENGHLEPEESTETLTKIQIRTILSQAIGEIEDPMDTSFVLIEMEEKIYPESEEENVDDIIDWIFDDDGIPSDLDPTSEEF